MPKTELARALMKPWALADSMVTNSLSVLFGVDEALGPGWQGECSLHLGNE